MPLPSLINLDLSGNQISSIGSDRASNLSSLRYLDLSHNELIGFPSIIMNLPELNNLNLSNNHIYDLNNSTLNMGVQKLITLDLSYMPLVSFEVRKIILKKIIYLFSLLCIIFQTGALNKMTSLQTLVISTFVGIKDFNIPSVISDIHTLRNLNLKVNIDY